MLDPSHMRCFSAIHDSAVRRLTRPDVRVVRSARTASHSHPSSSSQRLSHTHTHRIRKHNEWEHLQTDGCVSPWNRDSFIRGGASGGRMGEENGSERENASEMDQMKSEESHSFLFSRERRHCWPPRPAPFAQIAQTECDACEFASPCC